MRYWHSFQYVFISPKWLTNLGVGVLCQLVQPIGGIVLMGYHFDMIEAMIRDGEENYPDFDTKRLLPYLMRGLWPTIIQLLVAIPLSLVTAISIAVLFGVVLTSNADTSYWIIALFAVFLVLVLLVGVVVLPLVLPLELRAGLSQSLRGAFSREFYVDFVKRCWRELIMTQLFVFVTGLLLIVVGILLCGVGYYLAVTWATFARAHLMYQIYMKYLERGGIPPVVKEAKLQV